MYHRAKSAAANSIDTARLVSTKPSDYFNISRHGTIYFSIQTSDSDTGTVELRCPMLVPARCPPGQLPAPAAGSTTVCLGYGESVTVFVPISMIVRGRATLQSTASIFDYCIYLSLMLFTKQRFVAIDLLAQVHQFHQPNA